MKELAAYLLLILGGNDSPTAQDVTMALQAVGIDSDKERLDTLLSELQGKDLSELMDSGTKMLATFETTSGGGAVYHHKVADEQQSMKEGDKVVEKADGQDEEAMDLGGGIHMFGEEFDDY